MSIRKNAILAIGMHRGGTSVLSRTLGAFGADLGLSLLAPDERDNPTGYWENERLVELNQEILEFLRCEYLARRHDLRVDADELAAGSLAQRLSSAILAEFGDADLIALKDPRLCWLAPFYEKVLASLHYAPKVVFIARPAAEVARSLQRRHAATEAEFEVIWLRTMLQAERNTRGMPRSFVTFAEVLSNPAKIYDRASADLGLTWPATKEEAEAALQGFTLEPVLKRSQAPAVRVPPLITDLLYERLASFASRGPTIEDLAYLDSLQKNVDYFYPALDSRVQEVWRLERNCSTLDFQKQELEAEANVLKTQLAEKTALAEKTMDTLTSTTESLGQARSRLHQIESSPLWRLSAPIRFLWKQRKRFRRQR